jgi:drug/metabolite transporter (DMT)-like permease
MRQYSGLLKIGLAGVIWGSIPIFVRMVDASPFVIVFWRVAFAAVAVLLYLLITGKVVELRRVKRRTLLALLAVGALLAGNWALFFGAFALTRVAVVELVSYTGPVFVAALTPLIARERRDRRVVVPLLLALGGTALIVGLGELSLDGAEGMWGALMAFGTALIYAALLLSGKRLLGSVSAPVLAFGQYAFATILLLPAVIVLPGPSTGREWGALATLGVVHTAAAILIFFSGLRMVRADHAAVFTYAEPVTAVIFAAIFLAEPLGWATGVGGAAVVVAGLLVARMAPSAGIETSGIPASEADPAAGSAPAAIPPPQDAASDPVGPAERPATRPSQELESAAADRSVDRDRSQR